MGIVLKTATNAIYLPRPRDGDSESCEASIQVHTALTGKMRVYRRTGGTRRLTYTIVMPLVLADNLREFLAEVAGEWLTLIDYLERTWSVMLGSNPVEFVEIGRTRVAVTLELIGVLI